MIQIKILYFFQAVEKNQQIMDLRIQRRMRKSAQNGRKVVVKEQTQGKRKETWIASCNQISAQKVIDLTKTMDSQQKYIKELETYLHRLLPSVIKDLKKENEFVTIWI